MRLVISGYVGKKFTGIGRNLINIINNINLSVNDEIILYTNFDMKDDFSNELNKNIKIEKYNVSKNSSMKNLLWTTFIFPFKVLKAHADVALIPNFTLLLFKFKPTVLIMHDLIEYNIPNKFSKLKMFYRTKLANPISSRICDKIITVSENSQKDIVKFLNIKSEKIDVIYNGVDRNKFTNIDDDIVMKSLDKYNIKDNFILYAGTIDHPGKNIYSVLKAFEKVKDESDIDLKLVIAGMPGKGYEVIQEEVDESRYRKDIILTGYITDDTLIALYNKCSAFCFVSLYEGFGIPPLEALACGAEVIVSNTSSLPEVIGEFGYKVDPTNINQISSCIKEILNGKKRNIKNSALEAHFQKFNWEVAGNKFRKIISEIVTGR